ncbi:hypothetical protein VTH06DRAFT_5130 [Thermothelomyces fergusii]
MAQDRSLSTEGLFGQKRKIQIELLTGPTGPSSKPPTMTRRALAATPVNSMIGTLNSTVPVCSPGVTTDWKKEYSKLRVHFGALEQRLLAVGRRARELRESRDGWIRYAHSLEAKIKVLEKRARRNQNTDGQRTPLSSAKLQPSLALEDGTLSDTTRSSVPLSGRDAEAPLKRGSLPSKPLMDSGKTSMPATPMAEDGARSADEETQDGSDEAAQLPTVPAADMEAKPEIRIKEEPSSDPPVVVSERPVRKRKHGGDTAGTPDRPRRIKSEQSLSSDPVVTAEVPLFCPHESLDLDDEERRIPTPRKPRDWEQPLLREEREEQEDEDASSGRHLGETCPAKQHGSDALPAVPSLPPRKSPKTPMSRVQDTRPGWSVDSGVADVAEEKYESFYSPEPSRPRMRSARRTVAPGRLHSLLHEGSPNTAAAVLPPSHARRAQVKTRFSRESTENVSPGENRGGSIQPSRAANSSKGSSLRRESQGKDGLPRPTRLRDRPLAELRPEDFKVNPKFNNGYKYAFDEVVRNREERAELAGCADPNCCGKKFRAMAKSELSAAGPGILSRVSEIQLMEKYLGHDAHQLVEMRIEQRQEIWLKAKTQDLANRYGRHRHRFARQPSPPGYWNPDFPSTQEIRARKEEAQRLEREAVEERWREAMRGGKWLFRDE